VTGSAAGRVLLNGKDKGSGFAITDSLALTAGHVAWSEKIPGGGHRPGAGPSSLAVVYLVDRGEPATMPTVVEYQPAGAEPIPVTRVEVSTGLDVAVLHLQRPAPTVLPAAGQVTTGQQWRVDTRPDPGAPVLTGTVTEPQRQLKNAAGKETTLIQLWVEQEVGSYQGYSGSPVIAQPTGGVLGVLVEQAFWRVAAQLGAQRPVANVLYAAPIEAVLAEFGLAGVPVARSIRDIPRPVSFEVRRPDQLDQVLDALTGAPSDGPPVALAGMGGSGKSVLAAAAARDPKVREAFPDGQFWLELGPDPPLLQLQASLSAALGDSRPITDVPQGRTRLSRLLAERRCLLVLDNVWDQAHVAAFAVAGPPCRVLVTTRDAATMPGVTIIPLAELGPDEAMLVLAGWAATPAGQQLPEEAVLVARECGYLPLALAVCGALINAKTHSWSQLLGLLRDADLDALPIRLEDYPHRSLAVALGASIATLLRDARNRYLRLAVFSGQGPVPAAAVQVLWGLRQQDTTTLIGALVRKSLLRAEDGRVSLHDLQMDYLVRGAPDLPALHDQLLAAYTAQCPGGWASGPDDGYFYQHLAHHLHQAGRLEELTALLLDLDWMTAKLAAGTIPELLADYDILPADLALRLVASALRLSANVLADNPGQLPSQLTGRLTGQTDPRLRDLLQRIPHWFSAPWLRPLTASLTPAGGPLLRILTGHDSSVWSVAVTADGRCAISSTAHRTVRVWDLDTGAVLRTLTGHDGTLWALAVSADGRRAVSGGSSGIVRVWELDTGVLKTLTGPGDNVDAQPSPPPLVGHDDNVYAVAVSADGRRAVSSSRWTMRVWDLESRVLLHTLTGHDGEVRAVAVSADGRRAVSGAGLAVRVWDPDAGTLLHTLTTRGSHVGAVAVSADGRRAVSGHHDGTMRIWDLDTGALLHTLTGHDDLVRAVAVSTDGRRAVSGSSDGTVRVWDLESGALLHTLTEHDDPVGAVAVSADGRRAVSGSGWTVRVWDLDTGKSSRPLPGHDGKVKAVAVSADGRRAVSSGADTTVRAWDLHTGALLHTLAARGSRVEAVAVSADGRRAVSGHYSDHSVRAWDLDTGALLHTLTDHDYAIWSVAVSADARRAVSGSGDHTVRVWDLDTGALLHTLTGHTRSVRVVAVSPDGRRAVSGSSDGAVRVWDLTNGKRVMHVSHRRRSWFPRSARHANRSAHPTPEVRAVAVSADGRRAVSGSGDHTVRAWDLQSGALLHTLTGHDSSVGAVAVSADGRRAVSGGGADTTVRVWDLDTGALLHTLTTRGSYVEAVAVSADGRRAVSGSSDGAVRVWDLAEGVELTSFTSDSPITALAATPSNTHVIAGTSVGPVHLLKLCGYEYASGQPPAQEPRP
jgi:WD40 repeat protein